MRRLILVILLMVSISAAAQRKEVRQFPLEQINVNGSQRYSAQAIIAATGLRTGQQTTQAALEQISNKLGSSGLFSLVEFRFGWGTKGVVATFNVTDNAKVVPIGFENLVWFSPNELATAIKQKLPLFTGVVPLGGDFSEQIASALQEILESHEIHGTVTALPQGKVGNVEAMLFEIEGHEIKVVSCELPGAEHGNQLELSELAKFIMVSKYQKSFVDPTIESRLKDIFAADGYLKVQSEPTEVKVVSKSADTTEIALITKVDEGQQYKFRDVVWSGNTLFAPEQLTKALNFPSGQIASLPKFRDAMTAVRRLYLKIGYLGIDYRLDPSLSTDGTAQFRVQLKEGGQYKMGELKFIGVDETTAATAGAEWTMKSGAPYDPDYPSSFMSRFGKFMKVRWGWRDKEIINDETRTVNLQIEIEIKK